MSAAVSEDAYLGPWARGFMVDMDGYDVEPEDCHVLYETIVTHHEIYDDRHSSWTTTDRIHLSEHSVDALYEAVAKLRNRHGPERHREHRYEYGPIRKVVQIAHDDLEEGRLDHTQAHRLHLAAQAERQARELARKAAEAARQEASDRALFESLRERFDPPHRDG